ncbi:endonuclease/exonuclease/phosphatase family protein [Glycomyces sp. NRRL B-16210]|uniref:endonuclease/exonuclease/phosphatase family protein n=1 Tax=Glycomyces sp. NRRL B-16210 TaxID=1463821 RepID=UPI00068BDEA9|nr:endonuclease/exonuclease/phosphatase family protein [Glycomyces sp. NRRL B-16210]
MSLTENRAPEADAEPETPRRRWCWGTRLVVGATAFWAAFLLAHLILSGRVWWWSLIEMVPPFALLVPSALLALAAIRALRGIRWRLWIVHIALFAIAYPIAGINLSALVGGAGAEGETDLTVFTWNADYWHYRWDDADEFYDYLLAQDADVYLLTEYLTRTDRVERIDDEAALREHFPDYEIAIASEMVTLSRHPIVETKALDTEALIDAGDPGAPPADDPWREYWTTKILRTDLDVDGQIVSMYNLHLSVPVPTGEASPLKADFYEYVRAQYQRRTSQFTVLNEDLDANPNPVFVGGDFNSTILSAGIASMRERLVCPDPDSVMPVSWPAIRFPFPKWWRLDWVCVGGGLAVTEYSLVSGEGLSDHDAQTVGLDIR